MSNLGRLITAQSEIIMAEQTQWQCEATGYPVPMSRKQCHLTVFIYSGTPAHGMVEPTFRMALSTSVNLETPPQVRPGVCFP